MGSLIDAARVRSMAQDEVMKKNLHVALNMADHVKALHDGLAARLPLLGYTDTASMYLHDDVKRLNDILSKIVELESPISSLYKGGSTVDALGSLRYAAWKSMEDNIANW